MKILVYGLPMNIGGIGSLIINIIDYHRIAKTKYDVVFEFLIPKGSKYMHYLEDAHYSYYIIPNLSSIVSYIFFFIKLFKRERYDYVWINNTSKVDIFLPLLAHVIGRATIIQHAHGVDCEERGFKRVIFRVCEKLYGKLYERLIGVPIACSEMSANYFYKDKRLRERCIILHNGIYLDKFLFSEQVRDTMRSTLGLSTDTILVGAVGRLSKVKNLPFLIKVISRLPAKFSCIIVGDGDEYNSLEEMIIRLKVEDRVFLLGKRDDIPSLLFAMDCFVMPSFNEGLPFSIVEAQATGLKCIASKGISTETDLFGNVTYVDLSEDLWVSECLKISRQPSLERMQCNDKVRLSGYSISDCYDSFIKAVNIKSGC